MTAEHTPILAWFVAKNGVSWIRNVDLVEVAEMGGLPQN
jgi:hypothetical protein